MKEGHIMTPQFFPQGLRVNADVDAYVETLQTVVVRPPWVDSMPNRGRLDVFHQDSVPSHEVLKIQDSMDGGEFSSSCHAKLMPAS
ncbi:hypothetical protein ACTXT7_003223 [Hymenolepis weldensis]